MSGIVDEPLIDPILLQSGHSTGGCHIEAVGSFDSSKLTAVSFAAMRLEIGSWQVITQSIACVACQQIFHSLSTVHCIETHALAPLQLIAKTKEAVIATCCYTRRQLNWEVSETGQKNKIELQWDDITSLRVTPMVSTACSSTPCLYVGFAVLKMRCNVYFLHTACLPLNTCLVLRP